jgi:hypothetical protein
MDKSDYLGARIARYVRSYYSKHHAYPSIAETARALGTGPVKVYDEVEACGELNFMLTGGRYSRQLGWHGTYIEFCR